MRRVLAAVTAAALGLALSTVAVQPAQAMPGCYANVICFYNSAADVGPIQIYSGNIARNTCLHVPHDLTSYIQNNTGVRWKVSVESDCGGVPGPILPNTQGAMNATWNNVIEGTVRTSQTSKHQGPEAAGVMVIDPS